MRVAAEEDADQQLKDEQSHLEWLAERRAAAVKEEKEGAEKIAAQDAAAGVSPDAVCHRQSLADAHLTVSHSAAAEVARKAAEEAATAKFKADKLAAEAVKAEMARLAAAKAAAAQLASEMSSSSAWLFGDDDGSDIKPLAGPMATGFERRVRMGALHMGALHTHPSSTPSCDQHCDVTVQVSRIKPCPIVIDCNGLAAGVVTRCALVDSCCTWLSYS